MSLSSDSHLSNERLKKAIERNRAKQARKSDGPIDASSSVVGESWTPPSRPSSRSNSRTSSARPGAGATRRTVAKPDDFEFTEPVSRRRRSASKDLVPVAYSTKRKATTTGTRRRKSRSSLDKKWILLATKGAWIFCVILILRLIFTGGGVIDYYTKKDFLQMKHKEYKFVESENHELAIEIEKIDNSPRYQKKLVRDHLGFIANDEFLILFAKE